MTEDDWHSLMGRVPTEEIKAKRKIVHMTNTTTGRAGRAGIALQVVKFVISM